MSTSASEARDAAAGRLGGARTDFVASLARKLSDARDLLTALEDDPLSEAARGELRRRLHALCSGARLLRFEAMARALQDILAVLDRGAQTGGLRDQELAFLAETLDDLPALAWGEAPPREAAPTVTEELSADAVGDVSDVTGSAGLSPVSVLVVGGESLADALADEGALSGRGFDCERTEDAPAALELARAHAPDVVVIDADHQGAAALVEALLDDPLTEPVPVVVVGAFRYPDEESRFIALGVTKTLTKPVAPEVVRRACDEILAAREGRTVRMILGEPTLEQLAERLSQELKGALIDSSDPLARSCRVPLGEGAEVFGALWGAIARVQAIVTDRTKGAVRFGADAPEGAIALAPWLHHDVAAADRSAARGRGAAGDVRLRGRRVVVADDDPGVTWFISDLLRTAGCEVHEALDGITARDLAFRVQPELVVSDILMPGLDGFALCRALRRDVALRDTPVMLLSWKEDLLQRVRELGASAAAYMRKESDSRAVLARVREVLRPRARIEARLRGDGEVRGRLDDLSPRLLLELVCAIRRDARVLVRDASFLYEVEVRDGSPRKATRTASDGAFLNGERALAMLLAVGAGRFVVASSTEGIRGDLAGTLSELIARPIAAARGAVAATTGSRTLEVEQIAIDAEVLEEYLRATPDPARSILLRLAGGTSPRQMLLTGEVSPSLLEDMLVDLSARCAIRAVRAVDGTDLLTPAVEAALAVLTAEFPPRRSVPPGTKPSAPPQPVLSQPRLLISQPRDATVASASSLARPAASQARPQAPPPLSPLSAMSPPSPSSRGDARAAEPTNDILLTFGSDPPHAPEASFASEPPGAVATASATMRSSHMRASPRPPAPRLVGSDSTAPASLPMDDEGGPPSSLEDAVMREISERSPAPGGVHGGLARSPIVEPSQLRPRSSSPPEREASAEPGDDLAPLPSIPPDAVVPAAPSNEEFVVAPRATPDPYPPSVIVASLEEPASVPSDEAVINPRSGPAANDEADEKLAADSTEAYPLPLSLPLGKRPRTGPREPAPTTVQEDPSTEDERSRPSRRGLWAAFGVLAAVVAGALRLTSREPEAARDAAPSASLAVTGSTAEASAGAGGGAASKNDDSPAADVPPGYGVLEIAAPVDARVRVDGVDAGRGPISSSVLRAGYHQVRIDQDGRNSQYVIEVRAGKTTHVKSSPLP